MKQAVYKYEFKAADAVTIPTHKIIKVLKFGKQNIEHGVLTLWALVDTETEPDADEVSIKIFGTGHPIPIYETRLSKTFIETVFDGPFVWHIFGF